jgi:nucleolar GTP-binding protein
MQDFKKLPTVLSADELVDKLFRRASRVGGRSAKERAINKLSTISNVSSDYFKKIISSHPSYDSLPEFYRELVDVVVDLRMLKKSLAALNWADKMIQRVISKSISEIKKGRDPQIVVKSTYGRIASIIEQIDDELRFLNQAKQKMREIPVLRDLPTVVVAGYPNVGKSSFVAAVSTLKPEIASYPFTTKSIKVGFTDSIQIIDTPGLLDRPLHKRNRIERRAILCLKHLADVVLFIIDPTETCGYEMRRQISLLEEVKSMFEKPVLEVYSKADLHNYRDRPAFSAVTGEGLEEIKEMLISILRDRIQNSGEIDTSRDGNTSSQTPQKRKN